MSRPTPWLVGAGTTLIMTATFAVSAARQHGRKIDKAPEQDPVKNAIEKVEQGRQTFRFDTFGDEAFWGDTLKLHQAIEGAAHGGVGPGVSPRTALSVGLKIDVDALPSNVMEQIAKGHVNLDDPAVTLALLRFNAVIGVKGTFSSWDTLQSVGIQCSLCHSTVDNSNPSLCFDAVVPNPGTGCIGHRLDAWSNRDLNIGAIVALAPDLSAVTALLGVDQATVRSVLRSWGPGKFDAELFLDGKAANPQQVTDGVVTGTNVRGATLIPPAFGLGGVNLHTWTGWGSVPHWNAFAVHGFGDLPHISPDDDRITPKLSDLQFYQLSIPSPQPRAGSFDAEAADRGDELFSGKARCNNCHVEPLWTDPGWNLHTPAEICVDSFQTDRAPDRRYRTSPIGALFTHTKGGFYHDGRFATLNAVVDHYNTCMNLNLAAGEKADLVQYLLSLTF
jgi:hypothetical protein